MNRYLEGLWRALSRDADPKVEAAGAARGLPVIWLLGKTGAGKSSLVRALTGLDTVEVGEGFSPCTRSAAWFDYPRDKPLLRFLDTRGLGEAGYDPSEDLAACGESSHVALAVARLDDPVQGQLAGALGQLRRRHRATRIIAVHTGADLVPEQDERARARHHNQALLEKAAGIDLPWVELALPARDPGVDAPGLDALVALLDEIMPEVALLLEREDRRDAERDAFARQRADVLWYAGAAGTADTAPLVGAVAVPAVQAAMLRKLGQAYGLPWTRERLGEFALALGLGAAGRYGASYALRQAGKLVPVLGQSLGAAASGTLSFAATFALGRAAAFYLYRKERGGEVAARELRALYKDALKKARHEGS